MKICLIEPPVPFSRPTYQTYFQNDYIFPHLGMGYIASYLESRGYEVDIIECLGQSISTQKLFEIVSEKQYDICGLIMYFFNAQIGLANMQRICRGIRKRLPNSFIFAGGYYPSLCPEKLLNRIQEINCCVMGEAELTVYDLVYHIANGKDINDVKGIFYRDTKTNKLMKTSAREYIENLDMLPFPKRVFFDEDYRVIAMETSRGCYGKCSFCVDREFYNNNKCKGIRYRSAKQVVEEIEYLVNTYHMDKLLICDENFLEGSEYKKRWLREFIDLMKEKNIHVPFRIDSRANDILHSQEFLPELKELGLVNIYVGIESFIQRQLDFYRKGVTAEQNVKAIEIVRDSGIPLMYGFILLEPFTTLDDILKNVQTLLDLNVYEYSHPCQDMLAVGLKRLFAPPGIDVNDSVSDESLIAENVYSYTFQNQEIDLFYNVTMLWKDKFDQFMDFYYLYNTAEFLGTEEEVNFLIKHNKKIKYLDLCFVKELCMKIKSKEIGNLSDSESMLVNWENQIKEVFASYEILRYSIDERKHH